MEMITLTAADLAQWDIGAELENLAAGIERVRSRVPLCGSPMEVAFLEAWANCDWPLMCYDVFAEIMPQYEVAWGDINYRLDFALPQLWLAIEIDGIEFHSEPDRFVADLERQRHLQRLGWTVYRFTGKDVYHKAEDCAADAVRFATWLLGKYGRR